MNVRPSSGRAVARPGSARAVVQPRNPSARGPARPNKENQSSGGGKLDKWDVRDVISKGSFGTVYKAINKEDGRLYALKEVNLKGMNRVDRQEAIDEARILASIDCQYITEHLESFIENDKLHIVMELAEKGSLHAILKGRKGKGLDEELAWKYFIQALLALNYLHGKKIIHRDIKTLNLFLMESCDIMLGDLGIARALSDNTDFCRTILGTPFYLSPELCEDKPYNEKSDVWALGVVLYEMCMTVHPFTALNEGALIKKIMRGAYAPVKGYSAQMVDMVRQCLTYDYRKRPDTFTLLRHPTIQAKAAALKINLRPPPRNRKKKPAPHLQEPKPQAPQSAPSRPEEPAAYQGPGGQAIPPEFQDPRDVRSYMGDPNPSENGGWPEPAAAAAAPHGMPPPYVPLPLGPSPAELAAQQRRGAAGAVPGGVDPYERTPPNRQQQQHQQQYNTAGRRPGSAAYAGRQGGAVPYGHDTKDGGALAYEMEQRMRLQEQDAALRAAAANAHRGNARGQHPGQQDHLGSIMKGGYVPEDDSYDWPQPGNYNHAEAANMRTAGQQQRLDSRAGAAPFAFDGDGTATRRSNEADARLWQVATPTYGRRRAADLAITGPSLRGSPGGGQVTARGGGAPNMVARYDAQSAVTSTTYMAPSTYFG